MTIDQNIFDLTLLALAFFLTTVLLFILYSRTKIELKEALKENWNKDYTDQETFLKTQDLSLKYSMSEANVKSLEIKLERLYADRQQLRKDFVEQSEIAVEWRQKHDKLKESFDSQKDYMERTAASWNKLSNEVAQLETELDRGNEMISWLKADLDKAFDLLREAFKLLKEDCDAVQEAKIKELDHLFKNPFKEKKPKGWNLKVYPRDEKGRVRRASDFIHKEFEQKPVKGIDHQLRSSDGDKKICDSITVTPVKSLTESLSPYQNTFNIPNPDHF